MTTNKAKKDKPELKTGDNKVLIKSDNQFPVVGIGASAGGLNAFKKLLKAIPGNSGMAYVLVQHLDPHHESFLPEILQKVTSIPVLEITDDMQVERDHIYVIPSNKMMVATDGVLSLAPRPKKVKRSEICQSISSFHHWRKYTSLMRSGSYFPVQPLTAHRD